VSRINEVIEKIGTLPPLPDTAVKLVQVVNDPRSTVDDIVETIRYDQAVTGEVLRLCNSAYFGLSRRMTSLNDAMLCLGTVKVLQLVMSVHTSNLLAREQRGYGMDPGVLWKHSVAVALAAAQFAGLLRQASSSLAFTAGLLHDIGKVILNDYVAEEFAQIAQKVAEEGASFLEAEQQVLGFSHQEIGGMIAERWNLPENLVLSIRHHHVPGALDPPNELVDIVHLADCTCLLFGLGIGADGLCYRADSAVLSRYNLHEPDLEKIGVQILMDVKRVETLFCEAPVR